MGLSMVASVVYVDLFFKRARASVVPKRSQGTGDESF